MAGGVKMQLYWHFKPSTNPPPRVHSGQPRLRVRDQADNFVRAFVRFAARRHRSPITRRPTLLKSGARERTYRRIRIASLFGNMQVLCHGRTFAVSVRSRDHGLRGGRSFRNARGKRKAAGAQILSAPIRSPTEARLSWNFPAVTSPKCTASPIRPIIRRPGLHRDSLFVQRRMVKL